MRSTIQNLSLTVIALAFFGAAGPAMAAPLPQGTYSISGMLPTNYTGDLYPFEAKISTAQVVGLGESDHGSGGFHEMKYRVIRDLVEKEGFRTILFETNYGDAKTASNYVLTCQGSPDDAVKGLFAIWQDPTDTALLKWLCEFNRSHQDDPVQFFGVDIQEPWNQAQILTEYLQKNLPDQAASLLGGLQKCFGFTSKSSDDFHNSAEWKAFSQTFKLPEDDYETCSSAINAVRSATQKLNQDTSDMLLALDGLNAWEQSMYYFSSNFLQSLTVRDRAMFEVFHSLRRKFFPNSRIIISAHNAHLAESLGTTQTNPAAYFGATFFGMDLAQEFQSKYVAIGLVGYDVNSFWANMPQPPIPTDPSSIELTLHNLSAPYLFVDSEGGYLKTGPVYQMNFNSIPLNGMDISSNFDGLFFLDQAPATISDPNGAATSIPKGLYPISGIDRNLPTDDLAPFADLTRNLDVIGVRWSPGGLLTDFPFRFWRIDDLVIGAKLFKRILIG